VLELPPPQAGDRRSNVISTRRIGKNLRRSRALIITIEKNVRAYRTNPRVNGLCNGGSSSAAEVPVVLTLMPTVVAARTPAALTDEGVNTHAAPTGRPEQASVIVPLNPVDDDTIAVVAPDAPGAEINTED
jgi:hypothetical protein